MFDNIIISFAFTLGIVAICACLAIGWVEYKEWKDKKIIGNGNI